MAPRDNQRQRLYDAEATAAHRHSGWHFCQTIPTDGLQRWVDDAMAKRAIRARWGRNKITVGLGRYGGRAYSTGYFEVGTSGRNPWVMLHEMAHCLTDAHGSGVAPHGPEFAGVYLFLIETVMGKDAAKALRQAYREHRVRSNRRRVPDPTYRVVTKAAERARRVEAERTPPSIREIEAAVATIRRAARAGMLGAADRKPRVHALATARLLEGVVPGR